MSLKSILGIIIVLGLPTALKAAPSSADGLMNQVLSVSDRSSKDVSEWAAVKVKDIFSYNWVNYKEVTEQAKTYFTKTGYSHYLKSLKDSGSTESVIQKKLILQVKTTGPAKVIKEGVNDNKYAWQIEVPTVFSYYSPSTVSTVKADIVLLVSRESVVDFKEGLAITQLLLKPYK